MPRYALPTTSFFPGSLSEPGNVEEEVWVEVRFRYDAKNAARHVMMLLPVHSRIDIGDLVEVRLAQRAAGRRASRHCPTPAESSGWRRRAFRRRRKPSTVLLELITVRKGSLSGLSSFQEGACQAHGSSEQARHSRRGSRRANRFTIPERKPLIRSVLLSRTRRSQEGYKNPSKGFRAGADNNGMAVISITDAMECGGIGVRVRRLKTIFPLGKNDT